MRVETLSVQNGLIGNSEEDMCNVKVWRDTAAFQSLLLEKSLKHPENSNLGISIQITGIGGPQIVPLHRVFLKSTVFDGFVIVGLVQELPITEIDLLLGNDVAGSQVVERVDDQTNHDKEFKESTDQKEASVPSETDQAFAECV